MKVGSYGTGGRTYTRTHTSAPGSGARTCRFCCSFFLVVILVFWGFAEHDFTQRIEAHAEIAAGAVSVAPGQDGLAALALNDPQGSAAQGRTVHVSGVAAQASDATVDQDFEMTFENAATVKRRTEYCQWQELRHDHTRTVGKDREGNDIKETETSYSYVLDWRPHKINSLFFDNPVAYNNPGRDPFPSYEVHAGALLGENAELRVDPGMLRVEEPLRFRIPSNAGISPMVRTHGFDRHDGRWIYSPYETSPLASVAKAAGAFFIDGVIDTGIQGVCTPGDIRIGWDVARFPREVSVVGQLDGNVLNKVAVGNGKEMVLSAPGTKTLEEIVAEHDGEVESDRLRMRLFVGVFALGWALTMALVKPDEDKAKAA